MAHGHVDAHGDTKSPRNRLAKPLATAPGSVEALASTAQDRPRQPSQKYSKLENRSAKRASAGAARMRMSVPTIPPAAAVRSETDST